MEKSFSEASNSNAYIKYTISLLIFSHIFSAITISAEEYSDQQSYENLTLLLKEIDYVDINEKKDVTKHGVSYDDISHEAILFKGQQYQTMPDFFLPKKIKAKNFTIDGAPIILMADTPTQLPTLDGATINIELKIP
jgi:hypothetical protein